MIRNKTDLDELTQKAEQIIHKYEQDDPEFWLNVRKQIQCINKMYLKLHQVDTQNEEFINLDYGMDLLKKYDAPIEKKDMDVLYQLFNFGLELELDLKQSFNPLPN